MRDGGESRAEVDADCFALVHFWRRLLGRFTRTSFGATFVPRPRQIFLRSREAPDGANEMETGSSVHWQRNAITSSGRKTLPRQIKPRLIRLTIRPSSSLRFVVS